MGFSHLWADKTPVVKHQIVPLRCHQGEPLSWAHFFRPWLWVPLATSLDPLQALGTPCPAPWEEKGKALGCCGDFQGAVMAKTSKYFSLFHCWAVTHPKPWWAHTAVTQSHLAFTPQVSPSRALLHIQDREGLSTSLKMVKCGASGRPAAAGRCFLGLPG